MATDSPEATGRTMPAQSPVAPSVSAANAVAEVEAIGADVVATQESKSDAAAATPSPAQAPPIAPTMRGTTIAAAPIAPATDEEQVLLAVLRLIDRIISPGTLSPVERAFAAGAKVIFDHLSSECERMLKRKVSDLTDSRADPTLTPESTGNDQPPRPKKASTRRAKKQPPESGR